MNALVTIATDVLTPAVFPPPDQIDAMLAEIERQVRSVKIDISTAKGRKEAASLAYKVARSRTHFDEMGKELVSGWKKQAKTVDEERARVRARLEALQAEVRKPLDDYEADEAKRIADHQNALQSIIDLGMFGSDLPASADVVSALTAYEALPDRDFQEFKQKAATARSETFAKLQALKGAALAREAEAAELARLRAEQVAREQQERDDRIAAEAAARATEEAEERAATEAKRVADETAERERLAAQEKADALAAAEKAERDHLAAIETGKRAAAKAEEDRQAAVDAAVEVGKRLAEERIAAKKKAEEDRIAAIEAERKRVADEAAAEAAATAKREADKAHKKAINNEAKAALTAAGLSETDAIKAITAIALGAVPNIKISY